MLKIVTHPISQKSTLLKNPGYSTFLGVVGLRATNANEVPEVEGWALWRSWPQRFPEMKHYR